VVTAERALPPRAVLVPVKAFGKAKARLAPALDEHQRAELARRLASQVVAASGDLPVAVVCDDGAVASWARSVGALVIWEPGRGLNGAVAEGVRRLGEAGVEQVVVAHADLPFASEGALAGDTRGLAWLADFPGVTLVPDRRRDGTNVVAVPTYGGFVFSYGPGSFARHVAEADRLGLPRRVVHGSPLGWDLDVPADLEALSTTPHP
jgi:2-phospho-L-lactate/phosphoenolpyruvate guanylyltransferase